MPLSDFETPSSPPLAEVGDSGPDTTNRKKKKRGGCFLRALLVAAVLFFVFLLILNGPGFRLIGERLVPKLAAKQGIEGQLDIDGTLWSGFSLRDVSFVGGKADQPLKKLELAELTIDYSVPGLIRERTNGFSWLQVVRLKDVSVDLVLPEKQTEKDESEKPEKEKSPSEQPGNAPSPFWDLLHTTIALENISAHIRQGEKEYHITNLTLDSPAGKDGKLSIDRLEIPGAEPRENISTALKKGPQETLSIGPLKILDPIEIVSLTVQEAVKTDPLLTAEAVLSGGKIQAAFTPGGTTNLFLEHPTAISLPELIALSGNETSTAGKISVLNLDFTGDFAKPPTWKIKGRLDAEGVRWDQATLDSASLVLQQNVATLTAKRPDTELTAIARIPLSDAKKSEQLADLPIHLDANLQVKTVNTLLADFAKSADDQDPDNETKPLPLSGGINVQISGLQFQKEAPLTAGKALIFSENLAWEGVEFDDVKIAAIVENPDQISIGANVEVDESTKVLVNGNVDPKPFAYTAKGRITAQTVGKLEQLLRAQDLQEKFGANLTLNWDGTGNLDQKIHTGTANLDIAEAKVGQGLPFTGKLRANYNGTDVAVPEILLQCEREQPLPKSGLDSQPVEKPNGEEDETEKEEEVETLPANLPPSISTLAGNLAWDGKTISVGKLSLSENDAEKLNLAAQLPFDPKVEGGFMAQTAPLDLKLSTASMALDAITRFFLPKPPIRGTLTTDLSASGPFTQLAAKGKISLVPEIKLSGDDSLLSADLDFTGDVQKPPSWNLQLDTDLTGLRWQETPLERLSLQARTVGEGAEKKAVADVSMQQSGTDLKANASLGLGRAQEVSQLGKEPIAVDADLQVGAIEQLLADFAPGKLQGLNLTGKLSAIVDGLQLHDGQLIGGKTVITSDTLALSGQVFSPLSIDANISEPDLVDAKIDLGLDEKSALDAVGKYHVKNQQYEGTLNLKADTRTGKLSRILQGQAFQKALPGTAKIEWSGSGDVKKKTHAGNADITADNLYLADGAKPIDIAANGTYTADSADFPRLEIRSEPLDLDGQLTWKDNLLNIPKFSGKHNGREVIDLSLSAPLDKEKLTAKDWFQQDVPLSISAKTMQLPIAAVMRLVKPETPVNGDVSLDLRASGNPRNLTAKGRLDVANIIVPQPENKDDIPVGKLGLDLGISNHSAGVAGQFNHPDVNPFDIKATLPFHPAEWATGERKVADENHSGIGENGAKSSQFSGDSDSGDRSRGRYCRD